MAHRISPRAATDLDEIWLYVAKESGSVEVANRLIDRIANRLLAISRFPQLGRLREEFGSGYRSFAEGEYVIIYALEGSDVLALRVVHGRREIEALFGP